MLYIVGAVIAWIGICLQLRHDSKEREKERKQAVRQDIYLFAAEQIGKMLEYIANFYDTNEETPREYTVAMERIHMIGGDETIKAAVALNDHIVQAFCELIPERRKIDLLEQELQGLQERAQASLRKMDKSIEEMREYNLEGNIDTQKWAVMQADYEFGNKQLQEIHDGLREGYERQVGLISNLAGKCMQRTQQAEELVSPLIVAARKELNAPFDEQAYQRMLGASHKKWKDNIDEYIRSMRAEFEELLKRASRAELEG